MKTEVTTIDGKKHVIKGGPQDYIKMVDSVGFVQNKTLTSIEGVKFKFSDVLMMQRAKD